MTSPIGRFHVLTDFTFQQRFSHAKLAALAIEGGADVIQFRQKLGAIRDILSNAHAVAKVCHDAEIPLVINDRIDIALAVGASGVHLGQTDMPLLDARSILGPDAIIGITAPSIPQARKALECGADYIGFGPVFPTQSKANSTPIKGLEGVLEMANNVDIPIIGIAGITALRAPDILRAGAHGVAVMTAISLADDPVVASREFREAIDAVAARR
ncbi:MAG: thiamine phosphate synthase [Bacteroidetes bacterium]|nr:thiamine phosphate synthase [Bacteroidota bacterium]MDA1332877.1 thiamine phosphate synthase [Bacteroidota bacterium]